MLFPYDKQIQLFPKTLIPDFFNTFGKEVTEKLLTIYAGTTIRVPSTKDQDAALRKISIYETLRGAGSASESRRLAEALSKQHKMSRRHVRNIYRTMRKLFKVNKKLQEEDIATGKHKVKRVHVKRKSKLRGM